MKRIPVEATEVVTVDETLADRAPADFSHSIVRLKPSAVAEQVEVKAAADELRQHAIAVKVLPRPPANRLIMASVGNTGVTEMPRNTRAFVMASIDPGKTDLIEYVSRLADAEGL